MNAGPIRILHLFGTMNRGGAEMRTLEVMRRLDPARFHLEFNALSGRPGTLDEDVRSLGGEIHHVPLGLRFPSAFLSLLRRRRIDVVHSHVHLASGALLTLARLAGVKTRIAHFRSTQDDRGQSIARAAYRRAMRLMLDRSATAIVGSGQAALAQGWSGSWRSDPRCRVIFNAIDPARFSAPVSRQQVRKALGVPHDEPLLLNVGRLEYPKNPVRSVEVLADLLLVRKAHLVFVGRGGDTSEERAVRQRTEQLGLGARVHLIGERSDVPDLLRSADVVLLTSTHEGIPGVVLEARASGTPVVASDLPGVREIADVLGGVHAVRLTDPDRMWTAKVLEALRVPAAEEDRVRARAQLAASPFGIDTALAQYARIYEQARP